MKEPVLINPAGDEVPFSKVPSDVLLRMPELQNECAERGPLDPEQQDVDFNNRYASIIVQERST